MTDQPDADDGLLVSTGVTQFVDESRADSMDLILEREAETHRKMGRHYWVVLIAHRGTDKLLDSIDAALMDPNNPPTFDADTMVARPGIACYVCAVSYHPRLRRRTCPGEPPPGY